MTAFVASNGLTNYFESYTAGSVNATLDTYAVSAGSKLVVRTDTYACTNHSVAFGSLDTVSFSGQGGELQFDPTYVRVIPYTGGSGNSPAFGATISQGGVSGVFLGAWTTWQVDNILPGAAIGATGFIKIGGKAGGNFAAGALTGITATASGPDVQGWIEVRGADTATITVPRIGKVSSVEAWFEVGTTNGTRGQILPCPTTGNVAGVLAGCWIETAAGSGVYERFNGAGSMVALSTFPTDERGKVVWQTTGGIRIGNDGTNGVGYLPPTGCKVRIPATILTCCTRTASGSGARVLPSATLTTRQEFVTTGAGDFDLNSVMCTWYANFTQAFRVKLRNCTFNDTLVQSEIASPLDIDNVIVGPTQAQLNLALNASSCFAGGLVKDSLFARFSLAASGAYVNSANYLTGVVFQNVRARTVTLRGNATTGTWTSTQAVNCKWNNCQNIGGRLFMLAAQSCEVNDLAYADGLVATTATNPHYAVDILTGSNGVTVKGGSSLANIANVHPYNGWVASTASYNIKMRLFGTAAAPYNCGSANQMGVLFNSGGNNAEIKLQRCYATLTRVGTYVFVNSDDGVVVENIAGDYADTSTVAALNATIKNAGLSAATTGQVSVYGSHWLTRFTAATGGFAEITCNEPTAASAGQCQAVAGSPQFNSSGSVLLTKIGDEVIWEMPYFAVGYTAFSNVAPTVTGTNVTYSANARWGNHDLYFQVDTGAGYGGTWLNLTAAALIANTFNSTTGFKLKIRAVCAVAAATNAITNMRVALTSTTTDQQTKLYPLDTFTLSVTGLVSGSDVVIRSAGTSTILASVDGNVGTIWNYVYETPTNVDIDVILPGYVIVPFRNLLVPAANSSLPVSQLVDRNYA